MDSEIEEVALACDGARRFLVRAADNRLIYGIRDLKRICALAEHSTDRLNILAEILRFQFHETVIHHIDFVCRHEALVALILKLLVILTNESSIASRTLKNLLEAGTHL